MTGSQTSHTPQDAGEMLQVKDMEFELVRPNFAHFQGSAARTSEDSGVLGREGAIDLRQDGYHLSDRFIAFIASLHHSITRGPGAVNRLIEIEPVLGIFGLSDPK